MGLIGFVGREFEICSGAWGYWIGFRVLRTDMSTVCGGGFGVCGFWLRSNSRVWASGLVFGARASVGFGIQVKLRGLVVWLWGF